jgi:hypothetical protein
VGRSARSFVVGALLATVLAVPAAGIAKAPSFAAWHAHWLARSGAKVLALKTQCALHSSSGDLAAGRCIAKGSLAVYPPLIAEWNREVAVVAKLQAAPCRAAIHAYWLATAKNYAETVAFFRAHRASRLTAIASDMSATSVQTIALAQARSATRAALVCG